MPSRNSDYFRRWKAFLCFLLTFSVAGLAHAVGRVQWKSTTLKEKETKSWQIEVTIYLPKAPDTPSIPVKFEFLPTVYYERDMTEGDKLITRNVPLVGRQEMIESVDLGFLDPGTGKIENRTRFSFKVTRDHGYEAGEYKVTIRDSRSGAILGTPTTIKFQGENEIIDRRPIVFTGKEKPKGEKGEGGAEKATRESRNAGDAGASEDAEQAPVSHAEDPNAGEAPPPVEKPKGGCGCRLNTVAQSTSLSLLSALGLLLLVSLRRRG
ncbi:MAG TPA: hypothetical protein VGJ84_15145 [Polyangiaceae bacterium]